MRRNSGLGVALTVSCQVNFRPACSTSPERDPTPGQACRACNSARRFCAIQLANSRCRNSAELSAIITDDATGGGQRDRQDRQRHQHLDQGEAALHAGSFDDVLLQLDASPGPGCRHGCARAPR